MHENKYFLNLLKVGFVFITSIFLLPIYNSCNIDWLVGLVKSHQQIQIPDEAFLSLEKKLENARHVTPEGETTYKKFYLTQDELNAYVQVNYGHRFPPEIKAWQIKLYDDEAIILILINLDEFRETLEGELSPMASMLLRGEITLRTRGYFYGNNGIGKFDIRGLRLGFFPIPVSLVRKMIISKSSEKDAEVLDKGFSLPDGFYKAKIANSQVIIN